MMHIVIFAGGTLRPGKAFYDAIGGADMFIAADSGAETALQYGCTPRIVVGDFDSLDGFILEELGKRGSEIRRVAVEKEDRKSTRLNSSHVEISYAVFCLKKKKSKIST